MSANPSEEHADPRRGFTAQRYEKKSDCARKNPKWYGFLHLECKKIQVWVLKTEN